MRIYAAYHMTKSITLAASLRTPWPTLFDLPLESATADLRLGDPPQWDSMGHMELLVAIENEFDVRFPAHQIATLTSVGRIADAVRANEQL